jgi:hypothetical protein
LLLTFQPGRVLSGSYRGDGFTRPPTSGEDDIGRHLRNASYPLLKVEAPAEHQQITLETKTLDRYVGQYQLGPNAIMTMSRDGDRFYTQLTGQPKFEVFAESERRLSAAIAKRFKDQSQAPGTEAALRHNIEELQRGEPKLSWARCSRLPSPASGRAGPIYIRSSSSTAPLSGASCSAPTVRQ